ncbi:Uncharacterised protein [Klebsiella pneumoniae]|nr:Uncharacterised protein [Klebsiella pneumoniae]SVJ71102.1 Uncharacterised protein [Klebsiella pneumoniae]SYG07852.1 Uncharacterised protein [Klebsiella pneumoniae]VGE57346.1 Uncharacterised protein [Klebsiella quasipneumoniae]
MQRLQHIFRFTGGRIGRKAGDHAAHFGLRQDLAGKFDRQRVGNELVVQALENCRLVILFLILNQAHTVIGVKLPGINLIER